MKKNQMPLTLKETIVLDGEYGLKELRSLSFEPSVSITEHADHVLIEGSLHLAGEGIAGVGTRLDEQTEQLYDRMQVINFNGDEQLEFEHYFPITVNVSTERVANVHLLDVYIDHIDYELKDERVLFIHADIVVDGVSKEQEPVVVESEVENVTLEADREDVPVPDEEIHELPIRLLPNPLKEWNQPNGIEDEAEDHEKQESEGITLDKNDSSNQEETIESYVIDSVNQDEPLVELRATPPLESLVEHQTRIEEGQVEEEPTEEDDNDQDETRYDTTDDQALMGFVSTLEDEMTTIKIHIAQQDETPEEIAERYGVSMIQLMKSNQFESRAPFERGRLVWIP